MTSQCQQPQNKKPEIWEVVGQRGWMSFCSQTTELSWVHSIFVMNGRMGRILSLTSKEAYNHRASIFSLLPYTIHQFLHHIFLTYKVPESFKSVVLGMWCPCCYHNITWEHVDHANSWSQSNSVLSSWVGPRPTKLLLWVQGSRFCQASLSRGVSPCSSWEVTGQSYHWVNFWFSHSRTLPTSVWFYISECHTDVFLYI